MPIIRLDKFLADLNLGSRKEVKELVKRSKVSVDEKVITAPEYKVDTVKNKISVNGEIIKYQKLRYIMLNKPAGIISATSDEKYKEKTVIDILDDNFKQYGLFPVGRLDKDTVGLIILSNDGKFAHNTLSPKKHVSKTYFAEISGIVTEEDIISFKQGIELADGYKCKSANLAVLESGFLSKVTIEISEGKYHQIKRMFAAVGKEVIYLKRLKFGEISLDEGLKEGEARELNEDEINLISKYLECGINDLR